MTLQRRRLLQIGVSAATIAIPLRASRAETYPARPVRFIVGFFAGGVADILARLISRRLSERLGQQFNVENRPGAGSNLATEAALRAPADGYTLLMITTANTINATLYKDLGFDFIHDVEPVACIAKSGLVLVVNPSVPAKTIPEFIAYAKANPGVINMASAGNGSAMQVAGELFKMLAGVNLVHVPYRGAYLPDLLGGQVQVAFSPIATVIEQIGAGKLRALATTSATRSTVLPDLPTVGEYLQGYEASAFFGVGAPVGVPSGIVDLLNSEVNNCIDDPGMRVGLAELGAVPMPMTPAETGKFIASESAKWKNVISFANIRTD